jgi:hypothetical protein
MQISAEITDRDPNSLPNELLQGKMDFKDMNRSIGKVGNISREDPDLYHRWKR